MSIPNISIENYGNSPSANNAMMICIDSMRIYFSYKTVVAFYTPEAGLNVIKNYWSTTTGKHLNAIDGGDKSYRLDSDTFNKKYTMFVSKYLNTKSAEWLNFANNLVFNYLPPTK